MEKSWKSAEWFSEAMLEVESDKFSSISMRMVQVIELADESDITSDSYDKEIILEGPGADTSRIWYASTSGENLNASVMTIKMEISSIEDVQEKELAER